MKQEKRHPEERPADPPAGMLVGRHAITEAVKAGRGVNRILLADGMHGNGMRELRDLARTHDIAVDIVSRAKLDAAAQGARHQGALAYVAPVSYVPVEEIVAGARARGEEPLLLLLDGIEDPHNLGALLRTADAAGVHGILLPRRRSVPLTETVARVSAGALAYVPVAHIGNVAQTIRALKKEGFWIAGADMAGSDTYDKANLTGALVLVIGSEGRGMSRLTRELCDFTVRLPMRGKMNSLNASAAGAVLMYEAMRQRAAKEAAHHG
ncbi:23S rRNA (guanosine(2251)-2'-O)-methyltransferase RlmB [Selenomonas sp. F0473]|uniref:23S rRNA (guanosine(2251)-2'-O)-methyltransferase RlmB n=1 Tax=Selenomonas sp. F0473 TaxID=999423 RepID=UPI0025E53874|nr:23S rRNA (guanosine(2251)-2'-O)-methyltransferase RlmB [Selenomonas sp. F0473]